MENEITVHTRLLRLTRRCSDVELCEALARAYGHVSGHLGEFHQRGAASRVCSNETFLACREGEHFLWVAVDKYDTIAGMIPNTFERKFATRILGREAV